MKIYIVVTLNWTSRFTAKQEFYSYNTVIDEVFDTEEKAKESKLQLDNIYKSNGLRLAGIVEREIDFKTNELEHQKRHDEDAIKSESLRKFNECIDAAVARYSYTDL